ncbi:MAG: sulfite exporter TauE/SafE family protein, partial [Chloroflexota bacterium]
MNLWVLGGALALGALVGVLTGLFGVGGGFLMTPLLNIVLGVPM